MTATVPDDVPAAAPRPSAGLPARVVGVVFSPRVTYAEIARNPRVLGALVAIIVIGAAVNYTFMSTDVGRMALIDQQISRMESIGMDVTDEMVAGMERAAPRFGYYSVAGTVVSIPLLVLVTAGIAFFAFSGVMGSAASFKQVVAVVVHSVFITTLQLLFVTPLNYVRESMSGATSLGVFFPMIDADSLPGMLLGSIDFFRIWWIVNLSIGLGVLYKKRTSPVAWSLLAFYLAVVLIIAGVRAAL